jgi:glycosyltransferase involved in cell wall biosynthesis
MIILSHPTGNSNVKAIASGLESHNMLYEFNTTIAAIPNNFWYILGGVNAFSDFRRRNYKPSLGPYIINHPYHELVRLFAIKFGFKKLTAHEKGSFCTDQVYRKFDKSVAKRLKKAKKNGATAVYAYEDGAFETFIEAKKLGLKCIYDLPIAYHVKLKELLEKEVESKPIWAQSLGGGIHDSEEKLLRKKKEMELADVVVVASDFVRNSLPDWALDKKIIQSPFGTPTKAGNKDDLVKLVNKKLRVLFVGSMTQRKGLGDLFEATKFLNMDEVELVVLGSMVLPKSFYDGFNILYTYEPTRSHIEVLSLMRSCDVFCLPSVVEGRALVMQEAMSQGLPIIITPNTGGEDLVETGKTGFLVPTQSPEKIAEKIQWFVNNKQEILKMGKAASDKALTYTWESYAKKIIQELQ